MTRTGELIAPRIGDLLQRTVLPVILVLAAMAPAFAAPGSGSGMGHLDSAAMQAAAGDVVLGAGAATAILAGMVVVVAASWRGFREMLQIDDEDDGGPDEAPPRSRRHADAERRDTEGRDSGG